MPFITISITILVSGLCEFCEGDGKGEAEAEGSRVHWYNSVV